MSDIPMRSEHWPADLRDGIERFHERFGSAHELSALTPGMRLAAAVSQFAADVLVRQFPAISGEGFMDGDTTCLLQNFRQSADGLDDLGAGMRQFRNRFLFRVLHDELVGRSDTLKTLESVSALADCMLDVAMRQAHRALCERFGELRDEAGQVVPLVTLGMGKLGGGELNFSSDIDIIFLYPRDGESDGPRSLSAQEYCLRWSRQVAGLLDDRTVDGFVFRVDTRLRPFGDSGPPVTSFAALEEYLLRHGRAWERYAYVKARLVGTRPDDAIRTELMDGLIRPFVYRRYVDYGLFDALRDMHRRIDAERRGLAGNVKLGAGGIREIEFIVQSLQMLRAGAQPELQTTSLIAALERLAGDRELADDAAGRLREAYLFLRKLENLIQARNDQQTHELPEPAADRAALALGMGYRDWTGLEADLERHRLRVADEFRDIAYADEPDAGAGDVAELWAAGGTADDWLAVVDGFDDPRAIAERLSRFREACERMRPDAEADRRLSRFLPVLLRELQRLADPVVALERGLAILEQITRRSAYIALLNENPGCTTRLLGLVERSAFIADQLARYPVLLDELLDPDTSFSDLDRASLAQELDERLAATPQDDVEAQTEALTRFQRISLFRIALADIGAGLPLMKASDSLTWLAEVVLDAALGIAMADIERASGTPRCVVDGRSQRAGFGIVAYGKLGGLELSYGSDLDLVFLHGSRGEAQHTDGEKSVDNAVFFARLVRRLVHLLTTRTSSGVLYEIDTRLRPSGRSGLLVTSLDAYRRYQREEAWTWEHQALLRARPVAGDAAVLGEFEQIRRDTLATDVRRATLREDVLEMRARMRRELDRSDDSRFDLKQGEGGIGDIEFLVQYLCLREAARHPSVIAWTDNIRQLDALADAGILDADDATGLQEIYRRYRRALHHRLLDKRDSFVDKRDFVDERRSVVAAWQRVFGE